MEITDVSVTKLGVDLEEPKRVSAGRQFEFRPAAIVVVETDGGPVGIGEGYGLNPPVVGIKHSTTARQSRRGRSTD